MNIQARYLYTANKNCVNTQENAIGYNSKQYWNKTDFDENADSSQRIPDKIYSVKIPHSLFLEKLYALCPEEIHEDGYGEPYTDAIVSVTFKNEAKKLSVKKCKETGERIVRTKYIIREHRNRKHVNGYFSLHKTNGLTLDKTPGKLRDEGYKYGYFINGCKYVVMMRSTSKSRHGTMYFVKEQYYDSLIKEWARMSIDIDNAEKELDIAGFKASESLILSQTIGEIDINPEEILLIPDRSSVFSIKASVTKLDTNKRAYVIKEDTEIENQIWDGQSLLDDSKFKQIKVLQAYRQKENPKSKSMVLLRNHWFKSAAFRVKIQRYFKDNNVTMEDVRKHGWTLAKRIEDIKLITTPNSLKVLKMKDRVENIHQDNKDGDIQSTFEYWLNRIGTFGVVKFEHTHENHMFRSNYQILQALPLPKDDIFKLIDLYEFPYMKKLRNDNREFIKFIGDGSDSNILIYSLVIANSDIQYTELFRKHKNNTLDLYKGNWKNGNIKIPDTDFLTVVSNPMEMLQYACGVDQKDWKRIHFGRQCYCCYYNDKIKLMATRNPCVCSGNIVCLENKHNDYLSKYMVLSEGIVVINSINSDILDRCSGMDMDSDTMWVSSNAILVEKARFCEERFLTPVCRIEKKKITKHYQVTDLSTTDIAISNVKIGNIVNIGQILQSYYWDIFFSMDVPLEDDITKKIKFLDYIYDKISMLSSMSGVEIDRAKREFDLDTERELESLRNLWRECDFIKHSKKHNIFKRTITEKRAAEIGLDVLYATSVELSNRIRQETNKDKKECLLKERNALYFQIDKVLKVENVKETSEKVEKPLFLKHIFRASAETSVYTEMNCPMDNLFKIVDEKSPRKNHKDLFSYELMDLFKEVNGYKNNDHMNDMKKIASEYSKRINGIFANKAKGYVFRDETGKGRREYFEEAVAEAKKINITEPTAIGLFMACFGSNQAKSHHKGIGAYRKVLLDILFAAHGDIVLECLRRPGEAESVEEKSKKKSAKGSRNSLKKS